MNVSRRVSDYPIYPDSASAERRIIPVTPAPIYRATHCRIELCKSQSSVKNSRLKRRAMTPKLTYAHILGLGRRRLSCKIASMTSAYDRTLRERLNGAR